MYVQSGPFPFLKRGFYLSVIGDFEKTEGSLSDSKLLQAGCLEESGFIMGRHGPGEVSSSPSLTKCDNSALLGLKAWAEEEAMGTESY